MKRSSRWHPLRGWLGFKCRWRALVLEPGLPISLVVGLWALPWSSPDPWLYKVAAYAALLVIGYYVGTSLVLRAMPPDRYAQVRIAGQSVQDVISTISLHIADVLKRLTHQRTHLWKFERELQRIRDKGPTVDVKCGDWRALIENTRGQITSKNLLKRVTESVTGARFRVDRIEAMKRLAAEQLGIAGDRLCDNLFQFSPAVFLHAARGYKDNCERLFRDCSDISADRFDEFDELIRENLTRHHNAQACMRHQDRLLENRDLHASIAQLGCSHSGSRSLAVYANALADLATRLLTRSEKRQMARKGLEAEELGESLLFLHFAQRIYPGLDLTGSLIRVMEVSGLNKAKEPVCDLLRRLQEAARLGETGANLVQIRAARAAILMPAGGGVDARKTINSNLQYLKSLPRLVTHAIHRSREASINTFRALSVERQMLQPSSPKSKVWLVTHGYSSSVRDVLVRGLRGIRSSLPTAYVPPALFVLQAREDERAETKILEYELTDRDNHDLYGSYAVGDAEVLLGLVRSGDKVVFLLGAECVSADLLTVRPRATTRVIDALLRALLLRKCAHLVVVIVDEYKFHDTESSSAVEWFLSHRRHGDRVTITGDGSLVDFAIAGHRRIPEGPEPGNGRPRRETGLAQVIDGVPILGDRRRRPFDRRGSRAQA